MSAHTYMHRYMFSTSDTRFSDKPQSQSQSYFTTDGQSVSMSWCRAQFVINLIGYDIKKLCDLSPRANYTDLATAACRLS
jgi:hypothetical protein